MVRGSFQHKADVEEVYIANADISAVRTMFALAEGDDWTVGREGGLLERRLATWERGGLRSPPATVCRNGSRHGS